MTKKGERPPHEKTPSWFKELIAALPLKKVTRAQAGNYLFDGLGLIGFGIYSAQRPPPLYLLIVVLAFLGSMIWCHEVSRPRR